MFGRIFSALLFWTNKIPDNAESQSSIEMPPHGMIDPYAFWDSTNPHRAPTPYPMFRRPTYEVKGPIGKAIFVGFIIALGLAMIFF